METRTVKVFKPCEFCEGTGLETIGGHDTYCRICQGHGEVIEKVYKGVNMDELELPTGRV